MASYSLRIFNVIKQTRFIPRVYSSNILKLNSNHSRCLAPGKFLVMSRNLNIKKNNFFSAACQTRFLSSAATHPEVVENKNHSIIKDTERPTGTLDKHEFQAETRMLLDIVARSLYSENEVNE